MTAVYVASISEERHGAVGWMNRISHLCSSIYAELTRSAADQGFNARMPLSNPPWFGLGDHKSQVPAKSSHLPPMPALLLVRWPALSISPRASWLDRKSLLQLRFNCPSFVAVKPEPNPEFEVLEGRCVGPQVCPLSRVQAGDVVCIKQLITGPELTDRLRELGFCEEQRIKLLARQSNFICQVCNARLAISGKLADLIMVQAVAAPLPKA